MRPGLVTVGVAFVLLAGGALVTVNLLPAPAAPEQDRFTLAATSVPPRAVGAAQIAGTSAAHGTLTVSWSDSGGPLTMYLYPAGTCAGGFASCGGAGSIEECIACSHGGAWSINAPRQFPYELAWASNNTVTVTLTGSAVEDWNSTTAAPLWSVLLVDTVAIALGAVGAVALFLGMFLRGGVYRGPAPVVSRSADDVEEIATPPARP